MSKTNSLSVRDTANTIAVLAHTIGELGRNHEFEVARAVYNILTAVMDGDDNVMCNGYNVSRAIELYTLGDKRVAAIKELRRITGIGLKEAKDFIDQPEFVAQNKKKFPKVTGPL